MIDKYSGPVVKTSFKTNELLHPIATDCNSERSKKLSIQSNNSFFQPSTNINKLEANSKSDQISVSKSVVLNSNAAKHRRQEINKKFNNTKQASKKSENKDENLNKTCHFTFIFDPNGRFCYWIGFIVSLAFIYNFLVIIYRTSFYEINQETQFYWMICDYTADTLYIVDIIFNFHTGFLEEGVLQTDPIRLRHHYMNTTRFYADCLCLLPLDILYLSFGFKSIFRVFRLVKAYKWFAFIESTERHIAFPNFFRLTILLTYLLVLFHWNACFSNLLSDYLSKDLFLSKEPINNNTKLVNKYLKEIYSSIKILTLVTTVPNPNTFYDYLYAIFQITLAIFTFAWIMGNMSNIINNLSNASKDFQSKLDAVKRYMSIRGVPKRLQTRVIKWFDFLWLNHKSTDDNQILNLLPYKLRAEIAIHVHLDTLKRVEIFQNTEAGFLNELVLRLKPVLFSPGDYVCRKGEVGKEMYIVNSGKLQVISENGKIILATLKAGSYFGEISILNMGAHGNRRTASVKSVGYSDLFCLSKEDLWEVLKEYPAVRIKLEAIAVRRLEKHKKPLSEILNLSRCKSLPSLKSVKPVFKELKRHGTLPASILKRTDLSLLYANRSTIVKFKPISNNTNNNKNLGLIDATSKNKSRYPISVKLLNNETNNDESSSNHQETKEKVALDLKSNELDTKLTSILMQEIDRLNKKIELLTREKETLKREKQIVIQMKTTDENE